MFPRSIGRYPVVAPLGRGGQADVFRGIHPTLPIEAAIKQSAVAWPLKKRVTMQSSFIVNGNNL